MLNNISNTNGPAFGANLRIVTTVKDSARLENIKKIFAERTPEYKETLSLTGLGREWQNLEYLHLGVKAESDTGSFFRNSMNTIMEALSDNEIVTKFIKGLKALKELKKREVSTLGFEDQAYMAKLERQRNLLIAQGCREKGNEVMASRFEFLAECFDRKIKKIDEATYNINKRFLAKLKNIADGDQDILNFKESI